MEKGGRKKNPQSSNQNGYKRCQGRIGNLIPRALGDEGTGSFYLFIFLRFQQKCILDATTELSLLYSQKGFSVGFFFFSFLFLFPERLRE